MEGFSIPSESLNKDVAGRIARNSALIFAAELVSRLISFAFMIYVARTLGATDFGTYSLAFNLVMIFSVIYDGGLKSLVVLDIARNRADADKYYHNLISVRFVLGVVGYGLILLAGLVLQYPSSVVFLISIVALQGYLTSFDDFHSAFFNAFESRKYEAWVRIFQKALFAAVGFALVYFYRDLTIFVVGSAFAALTTSAFSFYLAKAHIVHPGLSWDAKFIKEKMKEAWPFAASSVAISLYFYSDSVILSKLTSLRDVGHYVAAYRFLEASLIIPLAITGSVTPVLSRLFARSRTEMKKVHQFTMKLMFSLGLPIAVCGTILSREVILFLFGPTYEPSGNALAVLSWAVLVIFLNTVVSTTLNVMKRQRTWLAILVTGASVNVILNILLIPIFGFLAAAIMTVLTELIVFVLISRIIRQELGSTRLLARSTRIIASAFLVGGFVYLLKDFQILGVVALGIILYFPITLVMKAWTEPELNLLFEVVPGSRTFANWIMGMGRRA